MIGHGACLQQQKRNRDSGPTDVRRKHWSALTKIEAALRPARMAMSRAYLHRSGVRRHRGKLGVRPVHAQTPRLDRALRRAWTARPSDGESAYPRMDF